jgi:excisionase family DNA binding protein
MTGKQKQTGDELPERRTVSVPESAQMLGISPNAAYEAIRRGELPHLRIGRRVVVPLAALAKLLGE